MEPSRPIFGKPSVRDLAVFGVLILAIVVGVIVPGGTGETIDAIAGALLAFAILIKVGLPNSMMRRRGDSGQIKRD